MIEQEQIRYWNDEPSDGIRVDWAKVRANFKKIVKKKYWHIIDFPFEEYSYSIQVSERTGWKTTNIVLLGLIVYRMYGIQLEYFRERAEHTTPKKLDTLYNPIVENGYIEKIFGDEWNDVQYYGGFFRLIKRNELGKAEIVSSDYITHVIANDSPDDYKSSYNTIRGDMVFFDEFVGIRSLPRSQYYFKQNLMTVLRKRQHGVIFMCANNINFNNDFYADFGIRRDIRKLDAKNGDIADINKNGTRFYFRILPPDMSKEKQHFNRKYFGYAESGTAAITGGSWEMPDYPHIQPEWARCRPLVRNYYISHLGDLLRLTLCRPEKMGLICLVTGATRIYDDSRIFTVGEILDNRFIYKCGSQSAGYNLFWTLYKQNRWYYSTNEAGELVQAFIDAASKIR